MQTHVTRNSILAAAFAASIGVAFAQNGGSGLNKNGAGTPPPSASTPTGPAPSSAVPNVGTATEVDSSTATTLDYLFNHKAQEGSTMKASNEVASAIADKIKAVDVLKTPGLDNPQVRARFETYLSLEEVPQARIDEYFGKMKQISAMLKEGNPDTFNAWKMLYDLGSYQDLDAGISRELAARVEAFWNTDRTKNSLEMANTDLRSKIDGYNHNADLDAADMAENLQTASAQAAAQKAASNNGSSNASNATNINLIGPDVDPADAEAAATPVMGTALQGKMEMTAEWLNGLEARFKVKMNEIKENKISDEDRESFSDYIRTLYENHRYYHVILAADFYRALFNDADYPDDLTNAAVNNAGSNAKQATDAAHLSVKSLGLNASGPASAINQLSGVAGNNPDGSSQQSDQPMSIADEVTSALEINNRVSQSIEVFKYKADKGQIAAAADELQEAFVGNEFHPGLQGLARDQKEKVADFLAKIDVLKNQLEVRDFEQVEGQINAIQKIASDFDSTKPMALVNGIKLESRLRLGKAKLLAEAGNLDQAMQEFQTAAEEWPGNPDLNTSSNTFFKTESGQNEASTDFDRLEQAGDFRTIFDRQIEFAVAVKGDTTREQQLKDALDKVGKAKMAEEKANMLVMGGDVDGAWETIESATKDWPDDVKLNKMLADLSGRSADFVSAVNKARDAESKKELGYSLTWYVNAQGYYPASKIANDGIDRVSKLILNPPSASASTE
jgi:hypothetical protein